MCLHIDSDAVYLVHPRARGRVDNHFYLSDRVSRGTKTTDPRLNVPILTECRTLRNIISSAAESETIGIFHNGKLAEPIRTMLEELWHPQPLATNRTNNSTSHGILTSTIWDRGKNNKVDYFTKQLPPKHNKQIRSTCLYRPLGHLLCSVRSLVQGCVNTMNYMTHNPIDWSHRAKISLVLTTSIILVHTCTSIIMISHSMNI